VVAVDAFYGGEMGGVAIADVLFGKYNPSGSKSLASQRSSTLSQDTSLTDHGRFRFGQSSL